LGLLTNPLFISPLIAMLSAQILKVFLILILERSWVPERFTGTGGMPSSHSSTVAALSTSSAIMYGVDSPFFAISVVFGSIVIYDATGIRRAAGKHAEILNEFLEEFSHLFEEGKRPKALKTLLGHTYPQVFAGLGIGIGISFLVDYLMHI